VVTGIALASAFACTANPEGLSSHGPSGIPAQVDEVHLREVVDQVAAHPEWAPGPEVPIAVHTAVTSMSALCIAVERPPELTLYVSVDPSTSPWIVKAVEVFDPETDTEPRITFEEADYPDADLCRFVVAGDREPFPEAAAQIGVQGGLNHPDHLPLIQQALFAEPERFGVDRTSRPSINVAPSNGSGVGPGIVCYSGVVYQGGPRASVNFGLSESNGGWIFDTVRVTEQVLHSAERHTRGTC